MPVEKLTTQPADSRITAPPQPNNPVIKPCERAFFSAVARHFASSSGVRSIHIREQCRTIRLRHGARKMSAMKQDRNRAVAWSRFVGHESLSLSQLLPQ